MMELFWTQEAIRDRDAIYDYIEADSPVASKAWRDQLVPDGPAPEFDPDEPF